MNRRSFLKSTGILIGGLYLSRSAFGVIQSQHKGRTIRGRVSSAGKGIPDVAVSDGFNVVLTDKRGRYRLKTHPKTCYVFISSPSGYEINTIDGFAAIYLDTSSGHYDFDLHKIPYDDNNHSFLALGDPQIRVKEDARQLNQESIPDIIAFLKKQSKTHFHGISLGDSIWDLTPMWEPYKKAIARIGIPFFQTIGNHDKVELSKQTDHVNQLFNQHFGPTYYSFNRGKVHYVVLDNIRYQSIKQYDGYIDADQLQWLAKDLQHVPKDHIIILSVHIPVHNAVKNKEELYTLLAEYQQVHILSGHTHTNANNIHENIFEHTIASLCGAWWTGPVCADGTPRGYSVFEVNGKELSWFYKPIGRDRTHQFRTSVQSLNHGLNRLTVNVWDYDPEWKVTWYADDRYMGDLEQIKGYDELAVTLYKDEDLPADRRGWVEPKKTDHLFYAQSDARKVTIVVVDRFNNTYKETINLK